jgi:hypothetical protein
MPWATTGRTKFDQIGKIHPDQLPPATQQKLFFMSSIFEELKQGKNFHASNRTKNSYRHNLEAKLWQSRFV